MIDTLTDSINDLNNHIKNELIRVSAELKSLK